MTDMLLRDGLERYRSQVSILKKGYAQEKYRIDQICRSFLGDKVTRDVTSVDIATYRDLRLQAINPQTKKPLSPSTVRLEMSLLSNYFDIGMIMDYWGPERLNHHTEITGGILAEECSAVLSAFFAERRRKQQ